MAGSIFTVQTPALTDLSDGVPYCLGTVFTSDRGGTVTGIRWFFPATLPSSAPTVALYSWDTETTGTLLGSGTFVSPVAGQWNTADLDVPVAITASTKYVAVVRTVDRYVSTGNFFGAAVTNGHLTAPADTALTHNGKFDDIHGASTGMIYPQQSFNKGCYFADVVVEFTTEQPVSGSVTFSGGLARSVGKPMAGSATASGTAAKEVSRSLAGSAAAAGAVTREVSRALSGSATAAGAVTRLVARSVTGTLTPAGAVLKLVSRILGGGVTPQGAVSTHHGRPATWSVGRPARKWRAGPPKGGG